MTLVLILALAALSIAGFKSVGASRALVPIRIRRESRRRD